MLFLSRLGVSSLVFLSHIAVSIPSNLSFGQESPKPDSAPVVSEAVVKNEPKVDEQPIAKKDAAKNPSKSPSTDDTKSPTKTEPNKTEPAKKETSGDLSKSDKKGPSSESTKPNQPEPNKLDELKPQRVEKEAKLKDKEAAKLAPATKPGNLDKVPLEKLGSNTNDFIPGLPYRIHDIKRPRPKAIQPGKIDSAPPADARVLFDGKDLSEWYHQGLEDEFFVPQWKIREGYFEIEPRSGSIYTIESFGSCQLHIEWMIPEGTTGTGQGRGNSGIKLMERYEVQVLDSFKNRTYADGQAGSVYGQYPPLVNASREQGQWQTYEIFFEAPKYDGNNMVKAPFVTVVHNGILIQNHRQLTGPTGLKGSATEPVPPAAPLSLQDHGNRIRFRNIWVRDLP